MVGQQLRARDDQTAALPNELTAPTTKLVYLYLSGVESASVDQLSSDLGVGKLALLPVLSELEDRGLLGCEGDRYRVT